MTTIAEALGINWAPVTETPSYRLTYHAQKQAAEKGWTSQDVLLAAERPLHTYPSGRVHGQWRHVRGGIVAVVDPAQHRIITVYRDVEETDLRADQTDTDARIYEQRHLSCSPRGNR